MGNHRNEITKRAVASWKAAGPDFHEHAVELKCLGRNSIMWLRSRPAGVRGCRGRQPAVSPPAIPIGRTVGAQEKQAPRAALSRKPDRLSRSLHLPASFDTIVLDFGLNTQLIARRVR